MLYVLLVMFYVSRLRVSRISSVKVSRRNLQPSNQITSIDEPLGHHMYDLALAFDVSVALEQTRMSCGGAEALVNIRPNDQIHHAGLVFKRDEDDSRCGAGSLTNQHKP